MPNLKAELRASLLAKRRIITGTARHQASESAANLLVTMPCYQESQHIACYLARKDEIDTQPLIDRIWRDGKQCYMPVLSQQRENHLDFVPYRSDDHLRLNRYKILEPDHTTHYPIEKLQLIIIPLVGFDQQGNRLGMGGGYYDRTFEHLRHQCQLVGLAYDVQEIEQLPTDSWDIGLDAIVTETRVIQLL